MGVYVSMHMKVEVAAVRGALDSVDEDAAFLTEAFPMMKHSDNE